MKTLLLLATLLFTGCSTTKDYYEAVDKANSTYLKAYKEVQNESMSFDGNFSGKITYVKPKPMPTTQRIVQPTTLSQEVRAWIGTLAPTALGIAGFHYNYKSTEAQVNANRDIAISTNVKDASVFTNYSENFKNDSSIITTDTTNTSVAETTNTSVAETTSTSTDTSSSIEDTSVSTQTIPPMMTTDGNNTIGIN